MGKLELILFIVGSIIAFIAFRRMQKERAAVNIETHEAHAVPHADVHHGAHGHGHAAATGWRGRGIQAMEWTKWFLQRFLTAIIILVCIYIWTFKPDTYARIKQWVLNGHIVWSAVLAAILLWFWYALQWRPTAGHGHAAAGGHGGHGHETATPFQRLMGWLAILAAILGIVFFAFEFHVFAVKNSPEERYRRYQIEAETVARIAQLQAPPILPDVIKTGTWPATITKGGEPYIVEHFPGYNTTWHTVVPERVMVQRGQRHGHKLIPYAEGYRELGANDSIHLNAGEVLWIMAPDNDVKIIVSRTN
jgi:hypothetical protein